MFSVSDAPAVWESARKGALESLCLLDFDPDLGFDDFDHFAAFIFAAFRASAMRANFLVAIRAFSELRNGQGIVRAAG